MRRYRPIVSGNVMRGLSARILRDGAVLAPDFRVNFAMDVRARPSHPRDPGCPGRSRARRLALRRLPEQRSDQPRPARASAARRAWSRAAATTWSRARASRASSSPRLEPAMLDHLPGAKAVYTDLARAPRGSSSDLVAGCRRLAAQYSPQERDAERLAARRRHRRAPRVVRLRARLRRRSRAALRRDLERGAARRPPPRQRPPAPDRARGVRPGCERTSRRTADRRVPRAAVHPRGVRRRPECDRGRSDRRRQRPQRRPALPAGAGDRRADPARRLRAHRPVGQGEGAGQRLQRHHLVSASARRRRPTPAGGLRDRGRGAATPASRAGARRAIPRAAAAAAWRSTTRPAR